MYTLHRIRDANPRQSEDAGLTKDPRPAELADRSGLSHAPRKSVLGPYSERTSAAGGGIGRAARGVAHPGARSAGAARERRPARYLWTQLRRPDAVGKRHRGHLRAAPAAGPGGAAAGG